MNRIASAPEYVKKAHDLMLSGCTTREISERLMVSLKTAENYRNRVNRYVGFDRPWELASKAGVPSADAGSVPSPTEVMTPPGKPKSVPKSIEALSPTGVEEEKS